MPQTIDLINFPLSGTDVSQWPKLTCTQPGHLDLQDAGLRLPASRDIFFQDNGQLRSFDDTHRLVFDRAGGLLELHEAGAIRLLTGSPTPTERMRILATGRSALGRRHRRNRWRWWGRSRPRPSRGMARGSRGSGAPIARR